MPADPLAFTGIIAVLDAPMHRGEIITIPSDRERCMIQRVPVYLQENPTDRIGYLTRMDAVRDVLFGHGSFIDTPEGRYVAMELARKEKWPCYLEIEGIDIEEVHPRRGRVWTKFKSWTPISLILKNENTSQFWGLTKITGCHQ